MAEQEKGRSVGGVSKRPPNYDAPLIRTRDLTLFCRRPTPGPSPQRAVTQLEIAVLFQPSRCAMSWPLKDGRRRFESVTGPAVVLVAAGQLHACSWEKSAVVIEILLEARLQRLLLPKGMPDPVMAPAALVCDAVFWQFASALRSLCLKEVACDVSFFPWVAQCVAARALELLTAAPVPALRRLTDEQLRKVQAFVATQLPYDIYSDDLAHCAGLSLQYFNLLFKNTLGITPAEYIFRCRMQRAKELLLTGDHKIGAVARLVGFLDAGNFTSRFRAHFGISPRDLIVQARASSSVRPKISSERP